MKIHNYPSNLSIYILLIDIILIKIKIKEHNIYIKLYITLMPFYNLFSL